MPLRYYEFYYARKSAVDEQFILDNLAPTLRVDVQAHLLGATCRRIPLFQVRLLYTPPGGLEGFLKDSILLKWQNELSCCLCSLARAVSLRAAFADP